MHSSHWSPTDYAMPQLPVALLTHILQRGSAFARLKEHSTKAGAQALILAPTRELVIQLHKAVKELARYTDLRLAVLVGGDSMEAQFAELAANPDIILATPGQLSSYFEFDAAIDDSLVMRLCARPDRAQLGLRHMLS